MDDVDDMEMVGALQLSQDMAVDLIRIDIRIDRKKGMQIVGTWDVV